MIDWPRMRELLDEIGPEDFQLVTDLFLQEMGSSITALASSMNNPRDLAEKMHGLKGAAANMGFSALADLALAGERAAQLGDTGAVTIAELQHVFDASVTAFEADRATRLAA